MLSASYHDPRPLPSHPRAVTLLGSTGSIGTQALDIVRANPERYTVTGLAAGGSNLELVSRQAAEFRPSVIAVSRGQESEVRACLAAVGADHSYQPEVLVGPDACAELAGRPADVVLNGITGSIGLLPTLAALRSGAVLALANKESLIVGGEIVTSAAQPGQVVPVDSEHSAIAQCLASGRHEDVRRLVITASGGPFRGRTREQLRDVSVQQAMAHPNFAMGNVITVNSATLVNKGLEVIEAHLLFDVPMDAIDVVVHPQQMIHSMVEFLDGSTIAQVSPPSMLIPIALGLSWPDRVPHAGPPCDWTTSSTWTFEPVDHHTFPALRLAYEVGRAGGVMPAIMNAANEECVVAFGAGTMGFLDVVDTVRAVVESAPSSFDHSVVPRRIVDYVERCHEDPRIVDVLAAEHWARAHAHALMGALTS